MQLKYVKMKLVLTLTVAYLIIPTVIYTDIIRVPGDYTTVQGGINAASYGDTVLVSPGVYVENINLMGKAIHLLAEDQDEDATVLDGNNAPHPDTTSTVLVISGEGRDTVIEGFTIVGGHGTISPIMYEGNRFGGGIFCQFSSPTIRNNVVKQNIAYLAAGILANISSAKIENNIVKNNYAIRAAGGLGLASQGGYYDSVAIVTGNLIYGNIAGDHAGGVEIGHGAEALFSHNIVAFNNARSVGGVFLLGVDDRMVCSNNIIIYNTSSRLTGSGLRIGVYGSAPLITSNIVAYNDSAGGIFVMDYPIEPDINHNVVWGNTTSNFIGTDPAIGDTTWGVNENGVPCDSFHNIIRDPLLSGEFPWKWNLSYGSPCIDAGSEDLPLDPDGTVADAGAVYFSQLDSIDVTLLPLETEVEPGDTLPVQLEVENPGTGTFSGEIWTEVELPWGDILSPHLGPYGVEYGPGEWRSFLVPIRIPWATPPGSTYVLTVKLGFYPDVTVSSDSFGLTVLEGGSFMGLFQHDGD